MNNGNLKPSDLEDLEKGHGLLNIVKMILLVAILVGAWFLLDWLISGK